MNTARLASVAKKTIIIPKRIHRGPTDILKALSGTVKHSETKYVPYMDDDPYLKMRSSRVAMLAKISGVKTAKLILDQHPELFTRDDAEPKVEAYQPPERFTEDMDLHEKDLIWCIENSDTTNAIVAYRSLESKAVEIDYGILQDLLELVCYYNESQPITEEEIAEGRAGQQVPNKAWINDGLAEELFQKLKDTDFKIRAYNAIALGMAKHGEYGRTFKIFQEMKEQNLETSIELYNSLLDNSLRFTPKSILNPETQLIIDHMNSEGVAPNRGTFNALLKQVASRSGHEKNTQYAIQLYNEMTSRGIKPSLTTYYELLEALSKGPRDELREKVLSSILDQIKKKPQELLIEQDPSDQYFFVKQMQHIKARNRNIDLAKKLYSVYMMNPRICSKSMIFFSNLLQVSFTNDLIENSIELYQELVPYLFFPNPETFEVIIDALELHGGQEDFRSRIIVDLQSLDDMARIKNIELLVKDFQTR